MKWWMIGGATLAVIAIAGSAWGVIVSQVEQAKYEVVKSDGAIEIRDYGSLIVAEAVVKGERDVAINQGFRLIADYIFGNNTASEKVAMTAPVTQQANEKIAMTAPVIQQPEVDGSWAVHFVMPSAHTMESLPKPNNPAVVLRTLPPKRYAAIRFSGLSSADNLKSHTDQLEIYIKDNGLKPASAPTYAFFNPPWTLPFLRRTEVMIEIAR